MNQLRQHLTCMNTPLQEEEFIDRLIDNLPPSKYKMLQVKLLQQRQNQTLTIKSLKTQVNDFHSLDSPPPQESPTEKLLYTPQHAPKTKQME